MRWMGLVALAAAACSDSSSAKPGSTITRPLFDRDNVDPDFYALPFPNDLRRTSTGLDLAKMPAPTPLVEMFRDAAATLDGFGLNESVFVRFDGALDPLTLPDVQGSLAAGASVYLVDIDPASPHQGERTPIIVTFLATERGSMGANNLCARPYPGFSLNGATTYALVVTSRVHGAGGDVVQVADNFTPGTKLAPFLAAHPDDVVVAAEFTTQAFDHVIAGLRRGVFSTGTPVASVITAGTHTDASFKEFVGSYMAPNFQTGAVPYDTAPDGEIRYDADGTAIVARMEPMRFALTVPNGTVPAGGWPLVIYSHGTGGDYESFIDDGTGKRLAAQGLATISTDQVLHGPRNPGGDPELAFFNLQNPYAARDNTLQGAADAFSQMRLASLMSFTDGARIHAFNTTTKLYFFGHSQGGVTGPGFVAFEPSLKGAVLSGTAGLIYLALLYKTEPVNIPALVTTVIHDNPVDENNPTLAMVQMWMDRVDPINFAHHMVREPFTGPDGTALAPRNIFQSEGFTDSYAPNPGIEAFATAVGGDLVQLPDEQTIEGLSLRGRHIVTAPFSDNDAGVTAVLAQYKQAAGSDGHFVVFEVPSAEIQSASFLGTLATTGTATVVSPN